MIFKAIIKQVPINDNKYLIRIPALEDNTSNEFVLPALLCNQPGEYAGYKIDDVVFAEFENNKLDVPVIIGKLYTGVESDPRGYFKIDRLEVTSDLQIPDDTKLGGYSVEDFFKLYQRVENTVQKSIDYALHYDIEKAEIIND